MYVNVTMNEWPAGGARFRGSRSALLAALITLGLVLGLGSIPVDAAQLTVSWSDATPDDHTGFKVERKTGTTGAFAQVASTGPTVMSYLDTTLTSGTTYCYRVRAYNTVGDSPYTTEACAAAPTPVLRTLTVAKSGTGIGTVDTSPAGITCGSTCSATYTSGTTVALTATPATGATFTGWSGACTGTSGCALVLDADKSATATFAVSAPTTYALTVTKAGTGTGTVTSSPSGINCGSICSANYNSGTSVTLTAVPATGSSFIGWSGACTGTGTCTVSVTAATSVTATFALPTYALTVTKAGTGTGTVTSSPSGITCGATCSASYSSGTSVTLTAAPATGSTFTGWSGACTGTGTCTVSMTAATSATATFAVSTPTTYALTVTKGGTGTGTVTSSPAGIDCGSTCSASYNAGTSVTLTATPATGSTFAGWSGACTGTGSCVMSVTAATSVTATFALPTFALTVTKGGTSSGTVTSSPAGITCGSTCTASYTSGTSVTLTATPATGSTFTGWGGACSGTGSCVVSMTATKSATATFALPTYTLTLAKSGTGAGTVTSGPSGITCGSTCSASYTSGTSVTLTATPATGATFTGWGGACSGTGSCSVTVDAAKSVIATFTLQTFALRVTKNGTGSGVVTSSPAGVDCGATCSGNYPSGTAVTLTATPAAGSAFTTWGGACAGTGLCTLTMSQVRDVTATFTATTAAGSGLVAAYGFSEGTGKTVADVSGRGHAGTITGANWTSAGKFGSALKFDGRNDVVTINDSNLLDLTSGLTISAWVYPTTSGGTRSVVLKERSGGLAYGLYANDSTSHPAGKVNTGGVDTGMAGSTSLPLNTWSHLATTYDGVTLNLFVNGVQVGSRAVSGAIVASAGVLRIGGNSVWGQYFRGRIDEVRIYSRPLGIAEIQQDMQTPVR